MKRAIVLAGGGAKGGYEMGVWKALRHLNINYDIVTGTSVGSLTGVLMAQDDYHKAFKTWYYMDYKKVMDIEINGKFKTKKGKEEILKKYAKGASHGGYEMKGLEKVIDGALDEDKLFSSNIDYGLVTTYFPSFKGKYVRKKDLKKGDTKKYLLASCSCFPAFKPTTIGKSTFIDGGYYDNLPINLAISMGADEVIAIDMGAVGITRPVKDKKVKITYIKPKNDLGNFLAFEKDYARCAIDLGYNDTMKIYGQLEGDKYTFKKGSLSRNYKRIGARFYELYDTYNKSSFLMLKPKKIPEKNKEKYINETIERLAGIFDIDPSKVYRTSLLNIKIKKSFLKNKIKNHRKVKGLIKTSKIKRLFVSKELVSYIYDELDNKKGKSLNKLRVMFPNAFLCAIYLKTIIR